MTRPAMRFVPIKNVGQQAILALHRARQGLMQARTAQVNQLRIVAIVLHSILHKCPCHRASAGNSDFPIAFANLASEQSPDNTADGWIICPNSSICRGQEGVIRMPGTTAGLAVDGRSQGTETGAAEADGADVTRAALPKRAQAGRHEDGTGRG